MKKLVILFLTVCLAVTAFVACNNGGNNSSPKQSGTPTSSSSTSGIDLPIIPLN